MQNYSFKENMTIHTHVTLTLHHSHPRKLAASWLWFDLKLAVANAIAFYPTVAWMSLLFLQQSNCKLYEPGIVFIFLTEITFALLALSMATTIGAHSGFSAGESTTVLGHNNAELAT